MADDEKAKKTDSLQELNILITEAAIQKKRMEAAEIREKKIKEKNIKRHRQWKMLTMETYRPLAHIIWNWFNNFINSEFFEKIQKYYEIENEKDEIKRPGYSVPKNYLTISATIQSLCPVAKEAPNHFSKTCSHWPQYLLINVQSKDLYVQEAVKYGHCHFIDSEEKLLELTEPDLIAQVCHEITNNLIEKTIIKNIKKKFRI